MAIAAFEDILATYENRPPAIKEAMARAYVHPAFYGLSAESKGVLLSLLARIPQWKPNSDFGARADRCSQEVGVSRKTFTRAIDRFIRAGWLVDEGGGRTLWGRFCAYRYRFTEALLGLLGLVKKKGQALHEWSEVSHGLLDIRISIKEDHQERTAHECAENPKPPVINPLPEDVLSLEKDFGVHPLMVYRLMGIVGAAGYRLGDMLRLATPYLKKLGLAGNRAYRYIESMLSKGSGYGRRALESRKTEEEVKRRVAVDKKALEHDGGSYISPKGTQILIERGVAFLTYSDGRTATIAGQGMESIYEDIEAGILAPAV